MKAKLQRCDECKKMRRDVRSCGSDANGEIDGPDMCFICRKELSRGREWSEMQGKYVPVSNRFWV